MFRDDDSLSHRCSCIDVLGFNEKGNCHAKTLDMVSFQQYHPHSFGRINLDTEKDDNSCVHTEMFIVHVSLKLGSQLMTFHNLYRKGRIYNVCIRDKSA